MPLDTPHTWRVHPYAERPWRGHLGLLAILGVGALVALAAHSAALGAAGAGVLLLSTFAFFVPTRYEISEQGLTVERLGIRAFHPWERFRSLERSGRRVWLSRHPAGSRAARLRSVRVELPRECEETLEHVRRRIQARP